MRLAGHVPVDEPYFLLEEDGYEFEFPPSPRRLPGPAQVFAAPCCVLRLPGSYSTAPRWISWLTLLR